MANDTVPRDGKPGMHRALARARRLWAVILVSSLAWPARLPAEASAAGPGPAPASPARKPNRLINEKSPYLLEHAYNPVDWYPWGDEAFAKARRENKPIFLSIGYSTCHWCHVMARESFENEAMATLMNDSFVSIKVDREERPDIDQVYMAFVQATTGGGGWPMTVLLTPDLKPFFGGSYFPPDDRQGRPGLRSILVRMAAAWKADPAGIAADSGKIVAELRQRAEAAPSPGKRGDDETSDAYREIAEGFDPKFGGFGGAPKFPRPVVLNFLFEVYAADPGSERGRHALEMALFTLRRVAAGGIHDAIGGGFHRYSVDESWHVPHFEKMLYDQAQLACCYLAAYQITHEAAFAETARDILEYVRRDMTSPDGGFCSAEDADSLASRDSTNRTEGAFYVWTRGQIEEAAGKQRAGVFDTFFGVEAGGNAPPGPDGAFAGENILFQRHTVAETARISGMSEPDVARSLAETRGLLYGARGVRPRPRLDDKVLASWNGLMISAYARGYQVLGDPAYLEAARRAAAFIEERMYGRDSGLLKRSYCGGQATIGGFGDDYAFLVQGLLDLYEASYDVHWVEWARRLQAQEDSLFWDAAQGGYFGTTGKDANVLLRMKDGFDGAEPSMNSVSALNLLRLGAMLDDATLREKAEKTFLAFSGKMQRAPSNYPQMLVAADWLRSPPRQIVIDGRAGKPDTLAMLSELNRHFIPRKVVLLSEGGPGQQYFGRQLEFFCGLPAQPPDAALAYVCQDYACRLPTSDVARFAELLAPAR
jgi:uncharacterized protein